VSNLSKTPQIRQDTYDDHDSPSPWTMLITMLLLIAGLLLASLLMINHLSKSRTDSGETGFDFSAMLTRDRSMTAQAPQPQSVEPVAEPAPQTSAFDSLKKMVSSAGSSDKVRWPRLKLTGFGTSTDAAESFAIINGEHVHPGQIVDKVEVVEVRAHDVIVEYMGERKTLTVDVSD